MSELAGTHVAVIGAGFGGLSAAAHLSRAGARVTVLEKAATVGGKAAHLARDGFTFDTGPTVLTMPWVVEETLAAAGARLDEVAPLRRLDPPCRYVLPDEGELVISADSAATRASIARISRDDARRWDGFMADCQGLWEAAGGAYLEAPYEGVLGLSGRILRRGKKSLKLGAARGSLDDFACRHFESPVMRAFVTHFATYAGASPYEASAMLATIPYVEVCTGVYYPRGGIHALATALAGAIEGRGVQIRRGVEVTGLDVDETGRITGLRSRPSRRGHGEPRGEGTVRLSADAVVADVDPQVVVCDLLPERCRRGAGAQALASRTPSMSGFAWSFGVEGPWPEGPVHSMLFSPDVPGEYRAVFEQGCMADEPTLWVSVPSLVDPSRAPAGHHCVFVLTYAPATGRTTDWEQATPRLRQALLRRLKRAYGADLERRIRSETFLSPRDIARTGSPDGAIYGAAPHGAFGGLARPPNRARGVTGLYYVGGATHPGGGISLVMRGGLFASNLLARDVRSGLLRRSGIN